jgi:hypothetical protein
MSIVGGTILLVVVSIIMVFVLGRARTTAPADPNSPAGVVQTYIEALRAGDAEKSRGLLSRDARGQLDTNRSISYHPMLDENVRIVIDTSSTTDDSATVKVTISRFYTRSDPFSSGSSHHDIVVRLIREDGTWKVSQPIDPYALY